MKHEIIDRRALTYARLIVWLIDHDPEHKRFLHARENLSRLPRNSGYYKWKEILSLPWNKARIKLLEQSDEMQFLRQMTPFFGEICMPEVLRRRIINKYLICHGNKPIVFRSFIIPDPPITEQEVS